MYSLAGHQRMVGTGCNPFQDKLATGHGLGSPAQQAVLLQMHVAAGDETDMAPAFALAEVYIASAGVRSTC